MRATKLLMTLFPLAALGIAACSSTPNTTGTTGGTETTGGTTTGGTTTGGSTGGGTSSTGGSSSTGGDAGLAGLNTPCNPTVAPDSCAGYFLGCSTATADQLPDGGSTCQLPVEVSACSTAVGCANTTPPLHCVGGSPFGLTPFGCVYYCNVSTDCPTSVTSCQPAPGGGAQQICTFNTCGPGTANGTQFYGACSANGSNDGTCEPLVRLTTTSDLGICDQGGSAPLWQPCNFTRGADGGGSNLCAQNTTCVPFNSPNGQRTFCSPICSPAGALGSGPACDSGQSCLAFASPDFGVCVVDCGAGQACPSTFVCQTLQITATQTARECVPN
jgi:hypothetical protein